MEPNQIPPGNFAKPTPISHEEERKIPAWAYNLLRGYMKDVDAIECWNRLTNYYQTDFIPISSQSSEERKWTDEDMIYFFSWCLDCEIEWDNEQDCWLIAGQEEPLLDGRKGTLLHLDPLSDKELIEQWQRYSQFSKSKQNQIKP